MRHLSYAILTLGLVLMFSSCDGFGTKLEQGTPVSDKAALTALEKDSTNHGKRFAVEGYLHVGSSLHVKTGEPTAISIFSEPEGKGKNMALVYLKYSGGRNSFSVPSQFEDKDIHFTDNDGNRHAYNQKAMYSFTMQSEPDTKFNSETKEWEPTGELRFDYVDVRIDPVGEVPATAAAEEKTK